MDADDARWLTGPEGVDELRRGASESDTGSLAAAERLRRRLPPARAAAVGAQLELRRRARAKFGARAAELFFTADGLEQASRPRVASWRAERLRATGVRRVLDLGCGIGADALAFLDAGLEVTAVELDEPTAILGGANLGRPVLVGDAVALIEELVGPETAVFCDPARRTASGRSWRVEDLSPPWSFVESLLAERIACVKLGPGLPHAVIPDGVAATWVSDAGDLVELSLWSGTGERGRQAVLLPAGQVLDDATLPVIPAGFARPEVGAVLYEPDPAVIRAGLVDALAADLDAARLRPQLAYLLGAGHRPTPFATAFEVLQVLDAGEKKLRAWVRSERIGTLEIKKRGVDVDPAVLRRRLKPSGPGSATLVLTPTDDGVRALVVRRLPADLRRNVRYDDAANPNSAQLRRNRRSESSPEPG
ncbi:MAG: class I SAM-dependent methyltransferase [Micropruina sp.]|uniref:class I SAM-dependent methyltransferase n=1 Tax=Micropruina sp. TaxID=2737536 RepID=UPI0039E2780A